jgi:hypothetical protein
MFGYDRGDLLEQPLEILLPERIRGAHIGHRKATSPSVESAGLVNASFSLNRFVHNTAWIPGHLHLTVGTAVIAYADRIDTEARAEFPIVGAPPPHEAPAPQSPGQEGSLNAAQRLGISRPSDGRDRHPHCNHASPHPRKRRCAVGEGRARCGHGSSIRGSA